MHELVAPGEAAGAVEAGGEALLLALEHGHVLMRHALPALVVARGTRGKAWQRRARLGEAAAEREDGALGCERPSCCPSKTRDRLPPSQRESASLRSRGQSQSQRMIAGPGACGKLLGDP